jgi:hypothetical protein
MLVSSDNLMKVVSFILGHETKYEDESNKDHGFFGNSFRAILLLSPLGPHAAFTKDDCEDRQNEEEESS